jgi:hypothetical protein
VLIIPKKYAFKELHSMQLHDTYISSFATDLALIQEDEKRIKLLFTETEELEHVRDQVTLPVLVDVV